MKHGGHRDENTCRDSYASQNPGTDGQGATLVISHETLLTVGFAPWPCPTTLTYGSL
jgi:hypothetical protein